MFEKITNKANNTLLHLHIIRMIDKIMENEWYPIEDKDCWNLIYSANYFFDLHDIFLETFVAQRVVDFGKNMLLKILADKKLSIDQAQEISKLLATTAVKSTEKAVVDFDIKCKDMKERFGRFELFEKTQALTDLVIQFGQCYSYRDQLKIFSMKTKPLL